MTVWRMEFKCGNRGHNIWPACRKRGVAAVTNGRTPPIREKDQIVYEE